MSKKAEPFRHFTIDARVWNSDVVVMIGGERRQRSRVLEKAGVPADSRDYWLGRMYDCAYGNDNFGALTMFTEAVPWDVYVFFPKTPDRADIETVCSVTHELLHAAIAILRRKNITLCPESEEAYTYLTEHLTRKFWGELK